MKKVVIFGSTGMTGVCALDAAVKKGLEVRAFVRDPAKVPEHLKDKVEIFQGNVLEPDSVMEAVEGVNGVVILLGTRNSLEPTSDMSEGTKNIIEAMRAKNVKTVSACMSTFLLFEPSKLPERFKNVNDDHKRMHDALKECGLNWIAVLPPHIADEPSAEITVVVNPDKGPGRSISKLDLASFMIDCLSEPKYYKNTVALCNVGK
ncbi:flavin reductase (NADPH) [Plutella xylostella]|uniref:flavin reductase (NADPH) n=1 Tax=Plutella xylostella TaxID=51655 RepID=UPI0020323991|nr:flavin reductase (NADPH) [Plutella xylostella]XP_011563385.3 flavin reductase (NADPH) [Plutella xylostella]